MTKKVYLDPGHGDHDPGTSGNGLVEKELALKIALTTRYFLKLHWNNVDVRMSRTNDTFRSLSWRADDANEWNANVFVSIHHNGGNANGFETFRHSGLNQSTLQDKIHSHVFSKFPDWINDRGTKSADFAVLRETSMAAVLTENLFLGHKESADLLEKGFFLNQIALGHAEGIADFLNLTRKEEDMALTEEDAKLVAKHVLFEMNIPTPAGKPDHWAPSTDLAGWLQYRVADSADADKILAAIDTISGGVTQEMLNEAVYQAIKRLGSEG